MGRLQGKTAIVTGGAHGLGREFAAALVREGATVAIFESRDRHRGSRHRRPRGQGCFGLTTDVSDEAPVQAAVAAILERTGRIDILVNNAAIYSRLPLVGFADIDVALWDKVMAVNLRGPFLMVKHVVPAMIARKSRQDRQHGLRHRLQGHAADAALRDLEGRRGGVHARARRASWAPTTSASTRWPRG